MSLALVACFPWSQFLESHNYVGTCSLIFKEESPFQDLLGPEPIQLKGSEKVLGLLAWPF